MAFNDIISDALVRHDIDLLRFDAKLRRQVLGRLRVMQDGITSQLANVSFTNIARRSRLESLLQQVDDIIRGTYKGVNGAMLTEMENLAALEQSFQTAKLNQLFNVDIISGGLTPSALRAIGKNSNIFGAPAQEWWGRQSAAMRRRFGDEMRQGFLLGESTQDLVRRVRGSATGARRIVEIGGKSRSVAEFSGGIMDVSTREAEALVRTSVQSIANETRLATYVNNKDVIGSVMAQVTLDSRTSDICQSHGNRPDEWTLPDFEPVGGSNSFIGPPPWHFNCRSSLIPVTKSWEELQGQDATRQQRSIARKLDNNTPKRTRQSMDGLVPRDTGYNDWLKGQSKTVQLEVLGPGKHKLWSQGKLNLTQTIDQTGRPLTLHQLGNLPANKPLPLKLPPRAPPPLTLPRKTPTPAPEPFIAPPPNIPTVSLEGLRALKVGDQYMLNGEVFKVIKKTRGGLESVHWSTRTGKFVTTRNKTKLTFGKPPVTPPVKPPVKPPTGPTTTTAGAPKALFTAPENYRRLNIKSVFKDADGNVWKVYDKTNRGIKVVPWSIKSNRFLAPRNGRTFGFTSHPAKTFTASSGSSTDAVNALFSADGRFGKRALKFTEKQLEALRRATKNMGVHGFNKKLAQVLLRNDLEASIFSMGRRGSVIDAHGGSYGSNNVLGAYWNQLRALGMVEGSSTVRMAQVWTHEFGHHLDFTLFRSNTRLMRGKTLSAAAQQKLGELNAAWDGMIKEYRAASNKVGKRLGIRMKGGVMSFGQQKNNWHRIHREMKDVAQSSYSLSNAKEWFAENFAAYFHLEGSRPLMRRIQPATHNFFEMLMSREMEVLWDAL